MTKFLSSGLRDKMRVRRVGQTGCISKVFQIADTISMPRNVRLQKVAHLPFFCSSCFDSFARELLSLLDSMRNYFHLRGDVPCNTGNPAYVLGTTFCLEIIMSLSMYQASIPAFVRILGNLSRILDKAKAHAEARKIDLSVFVNGRLAPDMFPLSRQIQIATDAVKGGGARLAGVEVPSYPDTETSFDELQARITKTADFLKGLKKEAFDGSEDREVVLKIRNEDLKFRGSDYLFGFVIPNFYFHVTTTYDILRHNGVEIGKMDYLGDPNQRASAG
jgi:uncharacterized protein